MTIMTGVKSPWILGKEDKNAKVKEQKQKSDELGIRFI
jgi:hypothetical protein